MATSEHGFTFLLTDDGRPYRPSRCYIVADPKVSDPKAWRLELEPPDDAPWVHRIDDVKSWMLHGKKPTRQLFYDPSDPMTAYRELNRDEVFREYVRKLLEALPPGSAGGRKYVLMPALSDEKSRKRYKDALNAAIPGAVIAPEPEMVAEYFRLLKRNLELEKGENNVILVVDMGASTANMTIIVSRRDQTILDLDASGAKRDLRLQALRGDSAHHAGRWVDERLAEVLGVPDELLEQNRGDVLAAVEQAKLRCSRTGASVEVALPSVGKPMVVDIDTLTLLSDELGSALEPLFRRLCERLYENQTSTADAREKSSQKFELRGVASTADAHRLIDQVLLAGGTSLLAGFQESLLEHFFPEDHQPEILRVGSSFPVAAAAGGMAHVLRGYEPPRLRPPDAEREDEVFETRFAATLPFPILLGIKKKAEKEDHSIVLDPDDPFIDDGGEQPLDGVPYLAAGSKPRMRLVPGQSAGVSARRGRRFDALRVKRAPVEMQVRWDPQRQRAEVHSNEVERASSTLWIDVEKLRVREEQPTEVFRGSLPPDALAVDDADDVVIDIGMSKVVAIAASPGWITASAIESIIDQGLPKVEESSPRRSARASEPAERGQETAPEALPTAEEDPANDDVLEDDDGSVSEPDEPPDHDQTEPEPESAESLDSPSNPHTDDDDPSVSTGESAQDRDVQQALPHDPFGWDKRVSDQEFSHALQALKDAMEDQGTELRLDDIVAALLALSVRPVVLLAGPPGCGKSTLVRVVAHLLRRRRGDTFHEVAVQAHWEHDAPLFGRDSTLVEPLRRLPKQSHLILFDEVNLTRPEYFLARFFYAVEHGNGRIAHDLQLPPCRAFGTLNIDETSRPPSPKVVDRCFLLELDQVPWDIPQPSSLGDLSHLPTIPGLPEVKPVGVATDERVDTVLSAIHDAVEENDLRHDLLPSRRVLSDVRSLLSLHHRLDLEATGLLSRDGIVDRVIASRILVKLSGAFDQLKPALEAIEASVEGLEELKRTRRRLKVARQQARLGFISPWQ